ncbi:MAG: hypothetical protein JXB62_18415 [Pirellulales bacterium]|nr:hypothetical protein [Pirellulales bacterium]
MLGRQISAAGATLTLCLVVCCSTVGEEVRYYEKDGVTYRETRRVVQRPICETQMQTSTKTVYREDLVTEMRDSVRCWWTPVTEYHQETYLAGRWNPFVTPHFTTRLVPRTRWEQQTEVRQVPTTCRRLVPETRTVQAPVTVRRTVDEEVITRTVVNTPSRPSGGPSDLRSAPTLARREPVGGVAQLESDPPRQGMSNAWRASSATLR